MTRSTRSRGLRLAASGALLFATLACTVVRDGDGDDDAGPPMVSPPGDPVEVDLLIMADVTASSAHLAYHYSEIVGAIENGIAQTGVRVRQRAVAPLRHRVGGGVPLLGADDVAGLVQLYSTGEGAPFLVDPGADDYANVLALGAELASEPLYGSTTGEAFFQPAADAFVVIMVSGLAARCEGSCETRASGVASALTATDASGNVAWLTLPGGTGLGPRRVVHVLVTSPEVGASHAAMVQACSARPNFPTSVLDFMAPSPEFHSNVAQAIEASGGRARWVDFCGMVSSQQMGLAREIGNVVGAAVRG